MDKVMTIIRKEWAEVFKNRLVLFTVAFLPLVFIVMAAASVGGLGSLSGEGAEAISGEMDELPGAAAYCEGLSELECVQLYTSNLFALMFMILPVAIPVSIAAYSIVGEKTQRSLEPLLATPITTTQLLVGKALAAIVPAVVVTWLSFILYALIVLVVAGPRVFSFVVQPYWLLAIFLVGPLFALLSVSTAVMVSSRVTDPRVAEQLSSVVILPIILLIVGQSVGLVLIEQSTVLILAAIVLVLDLVLGYLALQVFQREKILTNWK